MRKIGNTSIFASNRKDEKVNDLYIEKKYKNSFSIYLDSEFFRTATYQSLELVQKNLAESTALKKLNLSSINFSELNNNQFNFIVSTISNNQSIRYLELYNTQIEELDDDRFKKLLSALEKNHTVLSIATDQALDDQYPLVEKLFLYAKRNVVEYKLYLFDLNAQGKLEDYGQEIEMLKSLFRFSEPVIFAFTSTTSREYLLLKREEIDERFHQLDGLDAKNKFLI